MNVQSCPSAEGYIFQLNIFTLNFAITILWNRQTKSNLLFETFKFNFIASPSQFYSQRSNSFISFNVYAKTRIQFFSPLLHSVIYKGHLT